MLDTARRLESVVKSAYSRLAQLAEDDVRAAPAGMNWTRKQILGHLIDSASNNHQRFVRSQLEADITFPPYEQDGWIAAQRYDDRPWGELLLLWRSYNLHLVHLISVVPDAKLQNRCVVRADEPDTLGHHMTDYVRHLEHHLGQILGA
jgi:hypothetical protein